MFIDRYRVRRDLNNVIFLTRISLALFVLILGVVLALELNLWFTLLTVALLVMFVFSQWRIKSSKDLPGAPSAWDYISLFSGFLIITAFVMVTGRLYSVFLWFYVVPVITNSLQRKNLGSVSTVVNSTAIIYLLITSRPVDYIGLLSGFSVMALMLVLHLVINLLMDKGEKYQDQLIQLAMRDEVTGLPNYRCFQQNLSRELRGHAEKSQTLALLLVDIDHMKHYNDLFGFDAGNRLLKEITGIMEKTLSPSAQMFLYGAGQFAIILAGVKEEEVSEQVFRTKTAIESYNFFGGEYQPQGRVSITVGTALFPRDGSDFESLVNSASRDLDQAKHARRKEMEEQRLRAEKLALVGQLAAGLAHEIRNPLTTIKGFCQLIKENCREQLMADYMDTILDELERVNNLVKEFLLLTRPSAPKYQLVSPGQFLDNVISLMQSEATLHDIEIVTEYSPYLPHIHLDCDQMKQVIMNLLLNAIDAMPQGGKIIVRAYATAKQDVVLEIEDTGVGIPEEILTRVFEPFYTTKEEGTGLGLALAHQIVEAHKGSIGVCSKPGSGATFTITLPS